MKTHIKVFLENYATALMSFSAEKISEFYQAPLTVYSDQGIQQVTEMSETIAFWEEGVKPYKTMNIAKSVPEILSAEQLSATLFISKVQWRNYDNSGKEVAKETNFYILTGHEKELKICGLIIMWQEH